MRTLIDATVPASRDGDSEAVAGDRDTEAVAPDHVRIARGSQTKMQTAQSEG